MSAFDPKRTLISPSGVLDFAVTMSALASGAAMNRREFLTAFVASSLFGRSPRVPNRLRKLSPR